eukprot:gene12045-25241_t
MKRKINDCTNDRIAIEHDDPFQIQISDETIKMTIVKILQKRGIKKTCCPSEIPRCALRLKNWRSYMDRIRAIAFSMGRNGEISIMQHGKEINVDELSSTVGPIRLRIKEISA